MNYQLLTTTQQLQQACEHWLQQPWLAIDTEFIRQDTYYPELSLIQISTPELELSLIDPLAIEDLSCFWQLLSNPKLCKVFHSARQDIEVLYQTAQSMPQNIFDTQIAGVFFGLGDLAGFARSIEAELNIKLSKDQTRTNWHQRPLSSQQIAYALDDVRYLVPLFKKRQAQLSSAQKEALNWDFQQLLQPHLYQIEPTEAWKKVRSTKHLSHKQLGLLQQLAAWRETTAIKLNQPRKWIITDEALLALAKRPCRQVEELAKNKELKPAQIRQFGDQLIAQLDFAFEHSEQWPEKPQTPAPSMPQEDVLVQICQAYALQTAQDHNITLSNLYQRSDLLALVRQQPNGLDHGWRHLLLGKALQGLLSQQQGLILQNHKLTLIPTP